jgi:hypothetical protein
LYQREPLRRRFERRFKRLKAFHRITQALAGDPKIVQPLVIAALEPRRQRRYFARPAAQYALDDSEDVAYSAEVDSRGFHDGRASLGREQGSSQLFARVLGCKPFAIAKLVEQRPRDFALAVGDAAFEQLQKNGRVACGVGHRCRALYAAQQTRRRKQIGSVFKERSQAPPGRPYVVQSLLGRLMHEPATSALQPTLLGPDRFRKPLQRRRLQCTFVVKAFINIDLRRGYLYRPPRMARQT